MQLPANINAAYEYLLVFVVVVIVMILLAYYVLLSVGRCVLRYDGVFMYGASHIYVHNRSCNKVSRNNIILIA